MVLICFISDTIQNNFKRYIVETMSYLYEFLSNSKREVWYC